MERLGVMRVRGSGGSLLLLLRELRVRGGLCGARELRSGRDWSRLVRRMLVRRSVLLRVLRRSCESIRLRLLRGGGAALRRMHRSGAQSAKCERAERGIERGGESARGARGDGGRSAVLWGALLVRRGRPRCRAASESKRSPARRINCTLAITVVYAVPIDNSSAGIIAFC